ncbi:hypothetical protein QQS21_003742 [Conoideocrella luteorostrata]|uniref:Uncharacterized protein n=1 Tax=Conoideocrella luteorostrata TaxID=1105319 RepID=A0AAJ0CST7_9HYPO|nr:hypothetical protein QQS21_003742 [Conoideocrella luteorostrata]
MEAVNMNALPEDEQRSVWSETERNYWHNFDRENALSHAASEEEYQKQALEVKDKLDALTSKRTHLTQRQERLSKELTQVEEELARVIEDCDDNVTLLNTLEQEYRQREQEKLEKRSQVAITMERFFRVKQGEDPDAPSKRDREHLREILKNTVTKGNSDRHAVHAKALQQANEMATKALPSPVKPTTLPRSHAQSTKQPDSVLVDVVDADGHIIGPVERIDPWNQWVETIQDLAIKRQVKIRRGRKFTKDHLANIYDRSEAKGVKWIACMIQATGQVQQQRCLSCDKNQGAFDDCIILGGPLFQKCGNCEWNRQGCHMPMGNSAAYNSNDSKPYGHPHGIDKGTGSLALRGLPSNHGRQAIRPYTSHEAESATATEPIQQMPTPKEHREHPFPSSNHHVNGGGFTPANARARPPSDEIPTPTIPSAENSPQPTTTLSEITRSNLILRHNGSIYTYPECVEGVPLAKINQNHPYWDPRWPSVQSIIAPQLELWRAKNNEAVTKNSRGEGGSAKFQTGRQVNRGIKILEFLEEGEISPYQLLAKQYTHTGKGTITAYDTLFRMCETLGELAKFRLDISPIEWLRHRLHEIIQEEGVNFNYSKTMHDFYHDPKLAALRDQNGFKSIGRPSGYKAGQSSGKVTSGTPPAFKKRKSMHSQTDTPRATPSASHSPLTFQEEYNRSPIPSNGVPYTAEPAFNTAHPLQKRLKPLSPVSAPNDEFYTDGISDADSWSGAPLQDLDWRVCQVKTRLFTSNTSVTQYWHWKEDKRVFEYQVLKDTNPIAWGLLRPPMDFNIPLDDIVQVDWNIDALQVHFVMSQFSSAKTKLDGKPRGDVMGAFKRETTMRRFLSYCRQRRLKLMKTTADEMEQRWAAMQSEKMPYTDEEASPAFRE